MRDMRLKQLSLGLVLFAGACGGDVGNGAEGPAIGEGIDEAVRTKVHRLNRVEYNNTVRDLLGTSLRPANYFPPDDVSHGFDNIGDVLSMSPIQVEMYYNAAEALVDDVMLASKAPTLRFEAEDLGSEPEVGARAGDAWKLIKEGQIGATVQREAGTYRLQVTAWSERTGPTPIRMHVRIGDESAVSFDVLADATRPGKYEAEIQLDGSAQSVALVYDDDRETGSRYRNLVVDSFSLTGPLGVAVENPLRERIMVCDPNRADQQACLRRILEAFGERAWRRPLTGEELDELTGLVALGENVDDGIGLALRAVLSSPHFVFRVEVDRSEGRGYLDQFELASRLSYFLWSTMPDDELFAVAEAGQLTEDANLGQQLERMLQSPKAGAFVENFVGQWLTLRTLDEHEPDRHLYPAYDLALKNDMVTETESLFREMLSRNGTVQELMTADYTFANDRLAAHYDIATRPEGAAEGFARQALDGNRAGILGHASILTVTSHPHRTSPVKRGKWVLEQILCTAPPPPPPGVEGLRREETPTATLRERMELHRAVPMCAACHRIMDPIGFGLENFDGTGKWRIAEGEFPIDATGELPGGLGFDGGVELAALLAQDPRFPRCVASQMYTYAMGKAPEWDLNPFTLEWVEGGAGLRDLIVAIGMSDEFRRHHRQPRTN